MLLHLEVCLRQPSLEDASQRSSTHCYIPASFLYVLLAMSPTSHENDALSIRVDIDRGLLNRNAEKSPSRSVHDYQRLFIAYVSSSLGSVSRYALYLVSLDQPPTIVQNWAKYIIKSQPPLSLTTTQRGGYFGHLDS